MMRALLVGGPRDGDVVDISTVFGDTLTVPMHATPWHNVSGAVPTSLLRHAEYAADHRLRVDGEDSWRVFRFRAER